MPVLFLLYTIFPSPLRLYVDTLHAPIAPLDEVRELTPEEREELEAFRALVHRGGDSRSASTGACRSSSDASRSSPATYAGEPARTATTTTCARGSCSASNGTEWARARAARPFYDRLDPARPFVYFPLHVTDDYKITRVIPHCVDQVSLVEQVADALPAGYDLVLKEHPMSVGRNSLSLLRRLRRRPNVRLVQPAHEQPRADPSARRRWR